MNTRKSQFLLFLVVCLGLLPLWAQAARSTPVTVVNEATEPVPVNVVGGAGGGVVDGRFVGLSGASVTADVGYNGMNAACQATFGAQARMCNSVEIMKSPGMTVPAPEGVQFGVWVNPVLVLTYFDEFISALRIMDASGTIAILGDSLNCDGWSSAHDSRRGLILYRGGSHEAVLFGLGGCHHTNTVACCMPE